jgi:hypothetical protein
MMRLRPGVSIDEGAIRRAAKWLRCDPDQLVRDVITGQPVEARSVYSIWRETGAARVADLFEPVSPRKVGLDSMHEDS